MRVDSTSLVRNSLRCPHKCRTLAWLASLLLGGSALAGCVEDRVIGPEREPSASEDDAGIARGDDANAATPDAESAPDPDPATACNMTGTWIVQQVVRSSAAGTEQKTTNRFYHRIEQGSDSTTFVVQDSLDCGFEGKGFTNTSLSDSTLEALARYSTSKGRNGVSAPTSDGAACEFTLSRAFMIRGANAQKFLHDHWKVNDPDKDLSTFPALPKDKAAGMEDWDADNKEAITIRTTFGGDRYAAQRDWNAHRGKIPRKDFDTGRFGGDKIIYADWDNQEAISTQTKWPADTPAKALSPGYAWYAKVDGELTVVTSGDHPELQTCKNVIALSRSKFPTP